MKHPDGCAALVAVDLPVVPGRKSAPGSGRLPGSGGGDSGHHRVDGQIDSQLATLMTQGWSFAEREKAFMPFMRPIL